MNALLESFVSEGRDLLDAASDGLLALEKASADDTVVHEVFRSVHTLKGNAGFFEFPTLSRLFHVAEELMVLIRTGEMPVTPAIVDRLLEAMDLARKFIDSVEELEVITPELQAEAEPLIAGLHRLLVAGEEAPRGTPSDREHRVGEVSSEVAPKSSADEDGCPWPSWVVNMIPPQLLDLREGEVVTLFRYTPEPSCFFRGEDPLNIAAQVPNIVWCSVELDETDEDRESPQVCALVLRGVAACPQREVETAMTVAEGVEYFELSGGEAVRTQLSALQLYKGFVQQQQWVLEVAGEQAVPSVLSVLKRAEAFVPTTVFVSFLCQDGQPTVDELQRHIIGWVGEGVRPAYLSNEAETVTNETVADGAGRDEAGSDVLVTDETVTDEAGVSSVSDSSTPSGAPISKRMVATDPATPEVVAVDPVKTSPSGTSAGTPRVLRVEQAKVDKLMNLIGQLVVAKNGLPYVARRLESHGDPRMAARELKEHSAVVDRISRELQSAIMEVRMLPVSQVFQRFPRLVRDVSRKLDKRIDLHVVGEETRADKNIIEALAEPLIHLVRNALDHAIEAPEERVRAGKSEIGNIRLTARNENETVVITVEDDGRGIDADKIKEKAVASGLITPEVAAKMPTKEAQTLIFSPGLSTKEEASELSGRGVGMDVVQHMVEKLGARISLDSEVGVGTVVTLGLPLSMAVSHVMTVRVDGQLYGVGMDTVVETVRTPSKEIHVVKGREAFVLRDRLVPILRLRALLDLEDVRNQNDYGEEAVLVLRRGGENIGLIVDEFGENIEVLVRPLEGWMGQLKTYSGSAVLGDGRLLLVLDMKEVVRDVG